MFFRRSFPPWVNLRLSVYVLNDRETRGIFRKYINGLLSAARRSSQGTLHGLPELGSASFSTILSVALALPVCVLILLHPVGICVSPIPLILTDSCLVILSPLSLIFTACVLCFIGQNNHSFLNWFAFDGGGDYPPFSSMVFCEYLHHTKGEAS